jgi:uncharacterized membrane protein YeiH
MAYDTFLKLIEVTGVLAFSLTGVFEARRLKMDIVGAYSLAMITAFGAGPCATSACSAIPSSGSRIGPTE